MASKGGTGYSLGAIRRAAGAARRRGDVIKATGAAQTGAGGRAPRTARTGGTRDSKAVAAQKGNRGKGANKGGAKLDGDGGIATQLSLDDRCAAVLRDCAEEFTVMLASEASHIAGDGPVGETDVVAAAERLHFASLKEEMLEAAERVRSRERRSRERKRAQKQRWPTGEAAAEAQLALFMESATAHFDDVPDSLKRMGGATGSAAKKPRRG